MNQVVGFVGLGAMGAPMARRLASLGYKVLVHDLNAQAVESVVAVGAQRATSLADIGSQAAVVFTCLPSLYALEAVVLGSGGLLEGEAINVLVDFSTTGADFARDMASNLSRHGVLLLDSPITGNVVTAGNGKLGIMCSGPRAAFDTVEPAMRDIASTMVLYLGEQNGSAQRLKLLNNLLSATGMASSCEAFIVGVKGGLDPEAMLAIVNAGEASSSATRNKFAKSVLARKFDYGARMAITSKDTSLSVTEAEAIGVPMWIGQAVQQVWKYAATHGGADLDGTALITFLEPWAGVEVRARGTGVERTLQLGSERMPAGALVVLCEADQFAPLVARLGQQGWQVTLDGAEPSANGERACRVVSVADHDPASALRESDGARRIVVNCCLVGTQGAQRLSGDLAERGDSYVDALLAGTTSEIEQGSANVVAGGPAVLGAAVGPLLAAMGRTVFVVSRLPGDAQLMQLANAALANTLFAVTCEAYVAGAKSGLDPLIMKQILGLETGRNAASERIIPERVAMRKFDHGKTIGRAAREQSLISEEARRLGVTTWILDKTRLLYGLASNLGDPEDDITRLITHYEKWAGAEVRAGNSQIAVGRQS